MIFTTLLTTDYILTFINRQLKKLQLMLQLR